MVGELQDLAARQAALAHLERIAGPDRLVTAEQLAVGFMFQGERLPLINPQRGIFKPRQLRYPGSGMTISESSIDKSSRATPRSDAGCRAGA